MAFWEGEAPAEPCFASQYFGESLVPQVDKRCNIESPRSKKANWSSWL
jgi:hypothetical protein